MDKSFSIGQTFRDFQLGLKKLNRTPEFIQKHKLWHGFWNYGWATLFLVVGGLVIISRFMTYFSHILESFQRTDISHLGTSIGTLFSEISAETYSLAVDSSFKWIILILMEVVIFHAVRKTLAILSSEPLKEVGFDVFLKAQIRMFQLGIFSWVMEMVMTILFKTATGILGVTFLIPVGVFLIQSFLLGFTMIDNYIEQRHDMTMMESFKQSQYVLGIALSIGIVLSVVVWFPLIGVFVASLIGAVAASLAMYHIEQNEPYRVVIPEQDHVIEVE